MAEPSPSHTPPPALTPPMANPGSALPSPPASPSHSTSSLSSLSMPTNISEGGFLSDIAWSSRAPSPPHIPHDLFQHSQAQLHASDLRIPELELSSSTDPLLNIRQRIGVEGSTRIVVVGSGSESFPINDADAEILNCLKSTDTSAPEHGNWEEWEEVFEGLLIRVSHYPQRDIWIGYIPQPSGLDEHDFTAKLERYLTRPLDRIISLLRPDAQVTNDLRTLLGNTRLPYFTSVVLATSSGVPTSAQQNILSTISPLLPTLPVPPPARGALSGVSKRKKRCISAFRPLNTMQLRNGLLGDRGVRATLMEEAVEGLLRWRERQVYSLPSPVTRPQVKHPPYSTTIMAPFTDPLSLRSLMYLSYSILEPPLKQIGVQLPNPKASFSMWLYFGAFVAGISVGWVFAQMSSAGG